MDKVETVTIKVSEDARKALRLISALTGESIIEVVERLAKAESERLLRDLK
jgi:hypothetical protein